jgi:hypothetical protein
MIPLGYMAKVIGEQMPEWLGAQNVIDVYSVSECVNDDLIEETFEAPRNGYGFYNSPNDIATIARSTSINPVTAVLFYYEAHELDFEERTWEPFDLPDPISVRIEIPADKTLEGFDIVTWIDGPNSHSPLSCNAIAEDIPTNAHCLLNTLEEAQHYLNAGAFKDGEPGPYRVYAVYTVPWPKL